MAVFCGSRAGEPNVQGARPTAPIRRFEPIIPGKMASDAETTRAEPGSPVPFSPGDGPSISCWLQHRGPFFDLAFHQSRECRLRSGLGLWNVGPKLQQSLADIFIVQRLAYGRVQFRED